MQSDTLVYTNGGETYKGELPARSIDKWLQYGKDANQLYMHKGRRYIDGGTQQVVVFDNHVWDEDELKRRNDNGFIGIEVFEMIIDDMGTI